MTLSDIANDLSSLPEDGIIFAARSGDFWLPSSRAAVLELVDDDHYDHISEVASRRAPGMEYFLEVSVAREVECGWREVRQRIGERTPKLVDILIFYAENDAYPPLPD